MLAQQASSNDVGGHNFHIQEQPMHENLNFLRAGADQSSKPNDPLGSADSFFGLAKSARPTAQVSQADST